MLESGVINAHAGKRGLLQLLSDDQSPEEIVEKGSLRQVSNTAELEGLIDKILADHPSDAEEYRQGKCQDYGFFYGSGHEGISRKGKPQTP